MMEYRTVVDESNIELDERVNALMEEGWKPLGGVSISIILYNEVTEPFYAQAMVRQEPKPAIKTFVNGVGWEAEE